MNPTVVHAAIHETEADAIVVNLFEGTTEPGGATGAVDAALDGVIQARIAAGDFGGELGDVAVFYTHGAIPAERVLVVGLGPEDAFDLETARKASAAAAKRCRKLGVDAVATVAHGAGAGGWSAERAAQATVEGAVLALYRYRPERSDVERSAHRGEGSDGGSGGAAGRKATPGDDIPELRIVELDEARVPEMREGARIGAAMAQGAWLARDLVNGPPNVVTPTHLAEVARGIADEHGLEVHVGDRVWMAERDMGALLAVAKGAEEPPAFITLEHGADRSDERPLVLVGKGITFDSGGLSLKTRTGMITMKADMGGAAAVMGAMKAIAILDVPRRVIGIMPCTENMPDGKAYRPSDVVRAGNGKTIEIISTDAEGRLALADALVHAGSYEPAAVIDVATLTGSCVTALGEGVAAGLFSNDDGVAGHVEEAATATYERVWRLPLYDDYRKSIDSDVADMKNSGGAKGGVGTSAIFLQEFVSGAWAHLDIAGVVLTKKASGYEAKGATGFGVRLLTEAARSWSG